MFKADGYFYKIPINVRDVDRLSVFVVRALPIQNVIHLLEWENIRAGFTYKAVKHIS